MIRIVKCAKRNPEDYLAIALILHTGLSNYCTNSCEDCFAKRICKSVKSAIKYAVKQAGFDLVYMEQK